MDKETIDEMQSRENAAESMMDRMTDGLPSGMFRCDCGRVASLEAAIPASPSPWAPPICALCAEEIMEEMIEEMMEDKETMSKEQHTSEPWKMPGGPSRVSDIFEDGDYEITPPLGEAGPVAIVAGEANARRIVECVNACSGLSSEDLNNYGLVMARCMSFMATIKENETLRTRLSAVSGALRGIMKSTPHSMCSDAEAWALGEAALASIGEGVGS